MRTQAIRLRSKPLALLLVLLTLVGTNNVWHVQDDDHDGAAPVWHDHSAHHARFHTPPRTSAPAHCAFCHWLTALRMASPARVTIAFALTGIDAPPTTSTPRANTVDLLLQSPRAPPA